MTIRSPRRRAAPLLAAVVGALGAATAAAAAPAQAPAVANIRQLTVAPAPPGERLTVVLDRAARPVAKREAPDLLVIELDLARPAYGVHGAVFVGGLIAELRLVAVGVPSRPRTRLEISTRGASAHRLRVEPSRLVVDLVPAAFAEALADPPAAPVAPPAAPPAAPATTAPAPTPIAERAPTPAVEPTPAAPPPAAEIEEEELAEPLDPARSESSDDSLAEPPAAAWAPSAPVAPPPTLTSAELLAIAPAPSAPIAPLPRPASPRLREAIDAEAVTPLAGEPPVGPLDEVAPAPLPAGAPHLRVVPMVVPEPVEPLAAAGDDAPLAALTPAPPAAAAPRLREPIAAEPVPPLAEPAPQAISPAPAGAAPPPLRVEVAPPDETPADELARADELVPPAEIARPHAAPPPVAAAPPGPATRVMAIEQIDAGAVRIVADGTLAYLTFRLENPDRFVLELDGVVDDSPRDSLLVGEAVLVRVRVGQYRRAPRPVTRVVFDLRSPSVPEIESTPNGLVVRFVRALPKASGVP